MLKILVLICASVAIVVSLKNYNYNEYRNLYTCEGRPHTFFAFQSDKPASVCYKVLQIGLKEEQKKLILNLHNGWRQKVARGEELRGNPGPQPPARVMRDLEWDEELEDIAQRWANQCNFALDQCRDVERFKVNQMGIRRGFKTENDVADVGDMVKTWYNDVQQFDSNDVGSYNNTNSKAESYTQLVWAKTRKVGCGAVRHTIPGYIVFVIFCNYGPGGDVDGEPVYETF